MDKKKRDDVTTARRYKIFIEQSEGGRGTGRGSAVISKSNRVTNKLQFDINKTPLYYT